MGFLGELTRRSFWLPPATAMVLAIAAGYLLPQLDRSAHLQVGLFGFGDVASARAILTTIATVTVSVAGLSFSVTLVALQLASQQLSPRALTTFREDLLAQGTLAGFLGAFAYAIVLLSRLNSGDGRVPEISLIVAIVLVLSAFGLFVAFIGQIIAGLSASTVIKRIARDGHRALANRHPKGIGDDPAEPEASAREAERRRRDGHRLELRAESAGYLLSVDGRELIDEARRHDALVVQLAHLGDFAVTGQLVAEAFLRRPPGDPEAVGHALQRAFRFGEERTMAGDVAFPVRALADVALRGLSPSLNDPTTAENAMGSVADTLVGYVREPGLHPVRVDQDGEPRFVARIPTLDDLVRLGFDQARIMVVEDDHPMLAERFVALLREIDRVAAETGAPRSEVGRQLALLRGAASEGPGSEHAAEQRRRAGGADGAPAARAAGPR